MIIGNFRTKTSNNHGLLQEIKLLYTMLYDYEKNKDNVVLAMALAKVKQVFIS